MAPIDLSTMLGAAQQLCQGYAPIILVIVGAFLVIRVALLLGESICSVFGEQSLKELEPLFTEKRKNSDLFYADEPEQELIISMIDLPEKPKNKPRFNEEGEIIN
jgi:hypothetical protein